MCVSFCCFRKHKYNCLKVHSLYLSYLVTQIFGKDLLSQFGFCFGFLTISVYNWLWQCFYILKIHSQKVLLFAVVDVVMTIFFYTTHNKQCTTHWSTTFNILICFYLYSCCYCHFLYIGVQENQQKKNAERMAPMGDWFTVLNGILCSFFSLRICSAIRLWRVILFFSSGTETILLFSCPMGHSDVVICYIEHRNIA